ncbi:hypothetical protein AVEN_106813-1, partial [Araneus ventricosus]
ATGLKPEELRWMRGVKSSLASALRWCRSAVLPNLSSVLEKGETHPRLSLQPLSQHAEQGLHTHGASLPTFGMNISSTIFPIPFSHNNIAHKLYSVNTTHSSMNFCCTIPFFLKKRDDSVQLSLGGRINHAGHVKCPPSQLQLMCWTRQ